MRLGGYIAAALHARVSRGAPAQRPAADDGADTVAVLRPEERAGKVASRVPDKMARPGGLRGYGIK